MKNLFLAAGLLLSAWGAMMLLTGHEPVPDGKTLLTWATDDTPIRRAQVDLFNKLNPDLHLKIDPTNRDPNKVIVQSLGGVGPDVFDVPGTTLPIFVNSGIARDVTQDLARAGVDPARDFWPSSRFLWELNGRTYGVPANLDTLALLYNKDVFDKEGVPYPSSRPTWDEIVTLAKRLTKRPAKGLPERYGLMFWWNWRDFFAMENAPVFGPKGASLQLNSPQGVRAVQRMFDLIYKDRVSPSPTEQKSMATSGGWGGGNENQFIAGRAAMILGPRYFTAHIRRAGNIRVGVAPLPAAPGGGGRTIGRLVAVNSRTPRMEAALRFLAYVASADYNRLNNSMADGVGPVAKYANEPGFLFDPQFPLEKSNPAWRDAMLRARGDETSPFLPNHEVDTAIGFHLDLVSQGKKSPAEALRDAQRDAETRMANALAENRALKVKHLEALAR